MFAKCGRSGQNQWTHTHKVNANIFQAKRKKEKNTNNKQVKKWYSKQYYMI